MFVIMEHTMATLGDLIGFEDYLNASTPFDTEEYKAVWKSGREYRDFSFGNEYNETCNYPAFWNETGYPVSRDVRAQLTGCYDSDFDQYGDIEAFGLYPDWQRQLAKFASVQDRLREWHPPVRARIEHFTCLVIAQLDIDGFRIDKGVQVGFGHFTSSSSRSSWPGWECIAFRRRMFYSCPCPVAKSAFR